MMRSPDAEEVLTSLHRFFLLAYQEEARRRCPQVWDLLPLAAGSRLDLVAVNGGRTVHFFFSRRRDGGHVGYLHDVTVGGGPGGLDREKAFLARQFASSRTRVHFALRAPLEDGFDRVDSEARDAAANDVAGFFLAP